jgi:lamin tail-like protein
VPKLSINDVTKQEANSGVTVFTFNVSSSLPAPPEGITFDISTQDNTATTSGHDYVGLSLTSQGIPEGQTSYTFDVAVNGDTLVEPTESFFVNLSNVSPNATIAEGQGLGTISNDDTPFLVISQVYGGGNNAGATYRNDFIELFNRGTSTVDFSITPYSVQYAAATSAFSTNKTNITSGVLLPGHYFLIQEAGGNTNGVSLPVPDVPGGSINLSATSGKVVLVFGTTSLSAGTCPGDDGITPFNPGSLVMVDFIGYGSTANCYEGSGPLPVSATNANARSIIRISSCTDTNSNTADFTNPTTAPVARNTLVTPTICP